MEFHTALMSLLKSVFHRVPHWIRSFATLARKPCAPWFKIRSINGIRSGTDLKDHGVASGPLQLVKLIHNICLGLFGGLVLPLGLSDDVQPGTPELPLGIILRH